jgi:uncharacterized membrane protein YkoI
MGFIGSLMALAVSALLIVGGFVGPSVGVTSGSMHVAPRAALAQSAATSTSVKTEALAARAEANGADTDAIEEGDQSGPDSTTDVEEVGDAQDVAQSGTPAITAAAAQQTAEASLNTGTASKVALDDENGKLVYSVEIGASDVKVDAKTGVVLRVENNSDDNSD